MHCIILGASRGLGAALVDACLRRHHFRVIGIGRTSSNEIKQYHRWMETGRFTYYQMDLADPDCVSHLQQIAQTLSRDRLYVFFNAAVIESDMTENGVFDAGAYLQVSRVCINGFGHMLDAFGAKLCDHRGVLIGISSLSSLVPLSHEPMIAYPASKAFLTMALRSLQLAWRGKVKVVTVLLGHTGDKIFTTMPSWLVPSYENVSERLVGQLESNRIPSTLTLPWQAEIAYSVFKMLPDTISLRLFQVARYCMSLFDRMRKGRRSR